MFILYLHDSHHFTTFENHFLPSRGVVIGEEKSGRLLTLFVGLLVLFGFLTKHTSFW